MSGRTPRVMRAIEVKPKRSDAERIDTASAEGPSGGFGLQNPDRVLVVHISTLLLAQLKTVVVVYRAVPPDLPYSDPASSVIRFRLMPPTYPASPI